MTISQNGGWSRTFRSPGFKFFLVGALVILLTIPLALVWFVLSERETRANVVQAQIAADWGMPQRIHGPYLIVPYTVRIQTIQGDKTVESVQERRAIFLPDTFNAAGKTTTEVRRRSIYDVTVYSGDIALSGRFAAPDISQLEAEPANVRWQDAILALGIGDVSGLRNGVQLEVEGHPALPFEPSIGIPNNASTGIHARVGTLFSNTATGGGEAKPIDFKVKLALNGSSSLSFAPVGRETVVNLQSDWPHPGFTGGFLPSTREITKQGFSAEWRVPHLARSVPQSWVDFGAQHAVLDRFSGYPQPVMRGAYRAVAATEAGTRPNDMSIAVNFFVPVDFYSLVDRAAKYGLMFLAVAFGAVFVLELMSGRRVHAVQYIFVGLAMVMFYVLLLSFAEHLGFTPAYLIASVATGGMISLYVGMALGQARRGLMMLIVFGVLYGLLYLLLQLEDYALLAGAIAGFILLTATMFVTLRIDWSGDNSQTYAR